MFAVCLPRVQAGEPGRVSEGFRRILECHSTSASMSWIHSGRAKLAALPIGMHV
jgi:hypothetical protein